jgi:threonine 3-dehydrogenase
VAQLAAAGEDVVSFDISPPPPDRAGAARHGKHVRASVANMSEVLEAIRANGITRIFHLGAMLSVVSESNHWESHQVNVQGTMNILEAARVLGVEKVFFASSRGTFGLDVEGAVDDWSLQRPTLFYGAGKLYIEGVGRWYRKKFGLDFRSLRYPTMIAPGVRTAGHWAPAMMEDAIRGRSHVSDFGAPSDVGAFLYVRDAVRATLEVMAAPKEATARVAYNVAGMRTMTSAAELEAMLKRRYAFANVTYRKAPAPPLGYDGFDDSGARQDWGWQPQFDTLEKIVDQFEADL